MTFALFGTLVGAFMIAIGVGPKTAPDIIFHALLITRLTAGLIAAWRTRPA